MLFTETISVGWNKPTLNIIDMCRYVCPDGPVFKQNQIPLHPKLHPMVILIDPNADCSQLNTNSQALQSPVPVSKAYFAVNFNIRTSYLFNICSKSNFCCFDW